MKFSIIHASYGRPKLASETINKWLSSCSNKNNLQYILSVDKNDPQYKNYEIIVGAELYRRLGRKINQELIEQEQNKFRGLCNETNTSVAAINNAAKLTTGEIIIVISDDFEPIPNWDLEILKAVEGKEDWILKTQDGTQPWIITLPIMDRKYYERFGYIYYPLYNHMFCDTELTAVADYTGRKLTSDLLFRHRHYSEKDGIQKDATSQKADRTWNQGEELFLRRYKENFGIENHIPSKEVDQTIKWINKKNKR